ncbi:DUF2924 domain-containing protein [Magnetococcales bacterium HHB-1]
MATGILKEIAALSKMTVPQLKKKWEIVFDRKAPSLGKHFLIKRLAFRMQELAFGGSTEEDQQRLLKAGSMKKKTKVLDGRPLVGTRLVREWKGMEHWVTVTENGFEYQGRRFNSLSAIAKTITGTQWNGPAFFGLRKTGGKK